MGIKSRMEKELSALPVIRKGYSRQMATSWQEAVQRDFKAHAADFAPGQLANWHQRGYLSNSVKRYDLAGQNGTDYISDFEYMYLKPFNNTMQKWLDDIITTRRILADHRNHLRNVYFSIIHREGSFLILRTDHEDREYTVQDILALVKEKGVLELRPAFWASTRPRYILTVKDGYLHVDGEVIGEKAFCRLLNNLKANYVIANRVASELPGSPHLEARHYIKFWLANDNGPEPQILCSTMNVYWNDENGHQVSQTSLVDIETGSYAIEGAQDAIAQWESIKRSILALSKDVAQISFYTVSIALQERGEPFQILHFSTSPILPEVAYGEDLNKYLKARFAKKFKKRGLSDRIQGFKSLAFEKWVRTSCRKGIRPYMERLWLEAVYNDWRNTEGVSLAQKRWAWKRGFLSFRTYQYGLTDDNYTGFLSDYDYHWLNRINNDYQKWVNDKTTYRYIMEPFKRHVPLYYFSCYQENGHFRLARMADCPKGTPEGFEGLVALLKQEGKLALKASAGTHGDGFYCLSYENDAVHINGTASDERGLEELLESLKSFYIVTEYIGNMHPFLRAIYPKSVNTVRVMIVNAHGYDPQILQTYMRIGSEKTGYTDNVGYGGVCAMINKDTGELYQPEQLSDHRYVPCPNHPDTGTPIAGTLPNWDMVRTRLLEISRYLCELEYLGFDVAITDDGFRILEINIHQDLHKVASFTDEMNEFFQRKIADKRRVYNIK